MAESEKRLLPTWPELRKGIILSAICAVLTAPITILVREVFSQLGWLDPVAQAIAGRVVNVSPALAGWLLALILAVAIQALVVWWFTRKPRPVPQDAHQSDLEDKGNAPIRDRTSVLNAALYMLFYDWEHTLNDLGEADREFLIEAKLNQMAQDALDDRLDIWARPKGGSSRHIKLSAAFWEQHDIDWVPEHGALSVWPTAGDSKTQMFEPMVRKSDIEKKYGRRKPI